jgi:membrane protease YdiL (CAAX protease family)
LIGVGVHLLMGGDAPPFIMIREELHLIPLYLVGVVLMPWNGPVGEEFGWRGYALPKLQNKYASVLLSDSSLVAAPEGTHLTIAPDLYLTVLAVQVAAALVLILVTKGRLGYQNTQKL